MIELERGLVSDESGPWVNWHSGRTITAIHFNEKASSPPRRGMAEIGPCGETADQLPAGAAAAPDQPQLNRLMSKKWWIAAAALIVLAVVMAIGIPALPPTPGIMYETMAASERHDARTGRPSGEAEH